MLEDAWDYALVIDFMDLDDWRACWDHPRHLALAGRFMLLIDDIARVQYQIVPAGLTPRSATCTEDVRRSA